MRSAIRHRGLAALALAVILALLPAGAGPARAEPSGSSSRTQQKALPPEAVVQALYKHYLDTAPDTLVGFDYTDPAATKDYLDPSLAKLLANDSKSGTLRLDFDPFIDGQDFEIKSVSCTTKAQTARTATIVAEFENFEEKKAVTFKMVRTPEGWRIADVQWDGSRPTLRTLLSAPR